MAKVAIQVTNMLRHDGTWHDAGTELKLDEADAAYFVRAAAAVYVNASDAKAAGEPEATVRKRGS